MKRDNDVFSRRLGRREAIALLSATGASVWWALAGGARALAASGTQRTVLAKSCVSATPELTEGPYWVNTMLRRFDVRGKQAGVPLDLKINVFDLTNGCKPLDGVAVDIWHANAHGLYSDESSQQAGGSTSSGVTSGENFLRGYQITGKDRGVNRAPVSGQVSFKTVWPGWYSGRAIHIHVRVRKLSTGGATIAGYTTQIFFSDADNNRVLTGAAPYNTRTPQTDPTTDENDNVLSSADRATNIVSVKGSLETGFAATFDIGVESSQVSATGSLARPSAGGPPAP